MNIQRCCCPQLLAHKFRFRDVLHSCNVLNVLRYPFSEATPAGAANDPRHPGCGSQETICCFCGRYLDATLWQPPGTGTPIAIPLVRANQLSMDRAQASIGWEVGDPPPACAPGVGGIANNFGCGTVERSVSIRMVSWVEGSISWRFNSVK
jgi:hypothetical protein